MEMAPSVPLPLNITTTGNNPIVGVEFAVTMPMPMPIRPIPLYNIPRKRTIDEVYGEVNKLQQSFNWLLDKVGSRSETTEFRNIFNSYNTDTEFPCYPLDLTVPPSSPTKKSSSDDSNSIDQVEQVKTNLDTLVEAAETVSYAESVSSSSSNDTAEKDSGKSMDGYYLNRKQCHETFKKSGANIAKKCKELQLKTGCKVYYRTEFKTVSGKIVSFEYGDASIMNNTYETSSARSKKLKMMMTSSTSHESEKTDVVQTFIAKQENLRKSSRTIALLQNQKHKYEDKKQIEFKATCTKTSDLEELY